MEYVFTQDTFEEEVLKSDKPVLVDFFATWCGPCRMLSPVISKIADDPKYADKIKVGKIDVDENGEVAANYGVMSIPNLKIFKNGIVVDEIIGAVPEFVITGKLDAVLGE